MDLNQYIIEYLDGELSPEAEQKLFVELSYNEHLREDFGNILDINNQVVLNLEKFIPDEELTRALFNSLGYSLTNGIKSTSFESTHINKKGKLIKTISLITIITFLFITGIVLLINSDNTEIISKSEKPIFENNTNIPITESHKYIYPENIKVPVHDKTKNNNTLISGLKEIKNNEIFDNTVVNELLYNLNEISKSRIYNNSTNELNLNYNNLYVIDIEQNDYLPVLQEKANSNEDKISIEIKSAHNWNIPKETIYPKELSEWNNLSILFLYGLDYNFSIGVEVRQETFFLDYKSSEGFLYSFEQHPNLTSFGVSLRYDNLGFGIFQPYFQTNISGGNYGVISRLGVGMEAEIAYNLSLCLIMEVSELFYQHQDKWYNSQKFGLNYGINYKF